MDGITVLDLSSVGPGARCTGLLADLGARVVKVAAPSGRIVPPAYAYGGGRGTETVTIDLRAERDRFLGLAADADVMVESYRPGVAARLGIAYDDVRVVNPRVVYCSISGFGQDGPYASWAGHDLNYLALGGYLGCQGVRSDGGPALPGATIADSAAGGLMAALAIANALYRRERTGEGCFLDHSTTDGVLYLMALQIDEHLATGAVAGPGTTLLTGRYACYDVYRCGDGRWISLGAIEQRFFANLCSAIGRDDLTPLQYDDTRQDEIGAALRTAFASRTRDEWVADLAPKDTCVAPVLAIDEVPSDPHLRARGAFRTHGSHEQVASVVPGSVYR